ncbi:MAG: hypothetical protein AAGB22_02650 [Bacteroidota bacterium]
MTLRWWNANQPVVAFTLPVLLLGFTGIALIFGAPADVFSDAGLAYGWLFGGLQDWPVIRKVIACVLLFVEAMGIYYLIDRHGLLPQRGYLPAALFVLLISAVPEVLWLHPATVSLAFLLPAADRVLRLSRSERATALVFDAGLFVALASLFYLPAILLIALVPVALIYFRAFAWREWVIPWMGLGFPYLWIAGYYQWMVGSLQPLADHWATAFSQWAPAFPTLVPQRVFLGVLLLLAVLALTPFLRWIGTNKHRARKNLYMMVWLALLGAFIAGFSHHYLAVAITFSGWPIALYLSNYFQQSRLRWLAEVFFWMLLLSIALQQVFIWVNI